MQVQVLDCIRKIVELYDNRGRDRGRDKGRGRGTDRRRGRDKTIDIVRIKQRSESGNSLIVRSDLEDFGLASVSV